MRFISRKILIASSVAALGFGAYGVQAAPTATMTANFGVVGALSATQVAPMYFGTWQMAGVDAVNTVILQLDTNDSVTADVSAGTATATKIREGTSGEQTVEIEDGTDTEDLLVINMQHGAITDNTAGAALSAITYRTATEAESVLTLSTDDDVTIVDGGTPEPVFFGGTFTITDQIVGTASSTFVVTYSY